MRIKIIGLPSRLDKLRFDLFFAKPPHSIYIRTINKLLASLTGKSLSEALLFAEHVVYKNCSECQKQFLYTTCSPQV